MPPATNSIASPVAGPNFMVSPASWLLSWLSFQVPTKGFCAAAVAAAASERNSQTVANNHRPDRMGDLLCSALGVDSRAEEHSQVAPPLTARRRSAVDAIRALLLLRGCGLNSAWGARTRSGIGPLPDGSPGHFWCIEIVAFAKSRTSTDCAESR